MFLLNRYLVLAVKTEQVLLYYYHPSFLSSTRVPWGIQACWKKQAAVTKEPQELKNHYRGVGRFPSCMLM
jgi:hypothetical protein